jgi:hypothetical protein
MSEQMVVLMYFFKKPTPFEKQLVQETEIRDAGKEPFPCSTGRHYEAAGYL